MIAETERALARKRSVALALYRELLRRSQLKIVTDPSIEELNRYSGMIRHDADLPALVAALQANVDYLATLNRRHFIDDANVALRSGLRIGTPGDALTWLRSNLGGPGS